MEWLPIPDLQRERKICANFNSDLASYTVLDEESGTLKPICCAVCDAIPLEPYWYDEIHVDLFKKMCKASHLKKEGILGSAEYPRALLDQYTAVLEERLADRRALAAPDGDENLLAALYDGLEVVMHAIRQLAAAAAAGDLAAIEQLSSSEDRGHAGLQVVGAAFSGLSSRAGEYGLTMCG